MHAEFRTHQALLLSWPIEEARNIRSLLVSSAPYAAIDPCVGDATALIESRKTGAHFSRALNSMRTEFRRREQKELRPSTAAHSSAACWQKPARFCISNPPYDSEFCATQ
jgi:hypothetical protein